MRFIVYLAVMTSPSRTICFGEALWDLPPGAKVPGGAPMNVALHLTRLGVEAQLLSRVGDDDMGRELLGYLAAQGLNTDRMQIDRHYPTGTVIVDIADPREVQYEIVEPVAWDFIDIDHRQARSAGVNDAIVFGSLAGRNEVSRGSLMRLIEHAGLRIFDVNLRPPFIDRDIIETLLARTDWVKLNGRELELICGWHGLAGRPEELLRSLAHRYQIEVVCLTLGHLGAMVLDRGTLFSDPGFVVAVVDTIGCGDSFLACWLSQTFRGSGAENALARACAMGALVASSAGANPEVSEHQLDAIIAARATMNPGRLPGPR
jgi:fructokinase